MWPNLQETADFVKFTEEIRNWKTHFFCAVHISLTSNRSSRPEMLLRISQNSQENTSVGVSFLIKPHVQGCNFIKKEETLRKVISSEFC